MDENPRRHEQVYMYSTFKKKGLWQYFPKDFCLQSVSPFIFCAPNWAEIRWEIQFVRIMGFKKNHLYLLEARFVKSIGSKHRGEWVGDVWRLKDIPCALSALRPWGCWRKKHVDKYIALSFELEIGIIRGVHNLSRSNGQLISKCFLWSSISSKKQTKTSRPEVL